MGERVKQYDVDCFGIAKMIKALSIHFATTPPLDVFYILSPSSSALQAIRNPCNKSVQASTLLFHQSLTSFFYQAQQPEVHTCMDPLGRRISRAGDGMQLRS